MTTLIFSEPLLSFSTLVHWHVPASNLTWNLTTCTDKNMCWINAFTNVFGIKFYHKFNIWHIWIIIQYPFVKCCSKCTLTLVRLMQPPSAGPNIDYSDKHGIFWVSLAVKYWNMFALSRLCYSRVSTKYLCTYIRFSRDTASLSRLILNLTIIFSEIRNKKIM